MELNSLYSILAEVAFFGGLALVYYIIQKRRILSRDLQDNFFDLYEFMEQELPENNQKSEILETLHLKMQESHLPEILKIVDSHRNCLSTDALKRCDSIIKNIQFHQK